MLSDKNIKRNFRPITHTTPEEEQWAKHTHTHTLVERKTPEKEKHLFLIRMRRKYSIHVLHIRLEVQPEICITVKDLLTKNWAFFCPSQRLKKCPPDQELAIAVSITADISTKFLLVTTFALKQENYSTSEV